ncbi:hypothetical protein GF339_08275 [candidate division KSB3 bacterium]|uniref:Dephospho-CoA kinase n=1 Tax=candidate division KSB3 bacterium TaxID=2044937 RepID=A0A9D5Q5T0_9BACT|nr:hypothetical protein [candidate division KSB3 bacterium]MBD3324567.1 hypothetical protein [candidate division KSB3 bacterium]
MIVILNSLDLSVVSDIARGLADRYDAGAFVDIHRLGTQSGLDGASVTPCDEIGKLVASAKQRDRAHVVIKETFETPEALKRLRVCLSAYDNEIYAFRLRFTAETFERVCADLDPASGSVVSAAYAQWLEAQEAGACSGDMGYEMLIRSADPTATIVAIWNDIHAPVELVPYQEQWPEMFLREQAQILAALHPQPLSVEHIGSTAIPHMPAKPIIDILVSLDRLEDASRCISPLRALGYAFIDYPQNTDRRFFRKGTPRSHHLHLVEQGSASERDHLDFRDAILANDVLRQEYLQLKSEAMHQHKDRRALYGERKGDFIRHALATYRGEE